MTWPEETGGPREKLSHRGHRWGHLSWTRETHVVLALKRQEEGHGVLHPSLQPQEDDGTGTHR